MFKKFFKRNKNEEVTEEGFSQLDEVNDSVVGEITETATEIESVVDEVIMEVEDTETATEEADESEIELVELEEVSPQEEIDPVKVNDESSEVYAIDEETGLEEAPKKKGFFSKLVTGLTKTRDNILGGVDQVLNGFTTIDEDFWEELEEALIMADLGVNTTMTIIEDIQRKVKERKIKEPVEVKELLKEELKELMSLSHGAYEFENQTSIVLVIGVNGVGKTTSIGKLAMRYKSQGKKVILAAADTFRAAAIDQLKEWANRSQVDIIAQQENSDPGAVVYDAVQAAKSRNADILICDTAGRLHNKKNLMDELAKISRIIEREYPDAFKEILLVLDSTTGQNALQQAKQFKEIADISGIVLTKLDGTAKGGIAIAIQSDLKLPVKFIGVGEGIDDLEHFDENQFIDALFEV